MSKVLYIGDLHLGHANAIRFRGGFSNIAEHDELILTCWKHKVTKNDLVYVLGDVAFSVDALERLAELPGRKVLVRGNHDVFSSNRYLIYFEQIYGIVKAKRRLWLSHAPIHPDELRGGINIHGHVHKATIRTKDGEIDKRYINVSAENIGYEPRTLEELTQVSYES